MSTTIPDGDAVRNGPKVGGPKVGGCHDCGEEASVHDVADRLDPETGYQDQLELCDACRSRV